MSVRNIVRAATVKGPATPNSAPIYVDSDDSKIKFIPGGTGTTEVTVLDSLSAAGGFSLATVTPYSSDTILAGSAIALPLGGPVAGARYRCQFDMTKTGAGTAAMTVIVRIGTTGTTSDTAILTFTLGVGTAAIDTGMFELICHFRTVGATTTAVLVGLLNVTHALAATGLTTTGASGVATLGVVSSGFDSTVANSIISVSVNGGASFAGTTTIVESDLRNF
jgi:hypothetical protein